VKLQLPVNTLAWDYDNTLGKTEVAAFTNLTRLLNQFHSKFGSGDTLDVTSVMDNFKGRTARDILQQLNRENGNRATDADIEELVALELQMNIATFSAHVDLPEGANEALAACRDMGLLSFVQSSSHGDRVRACLVGAGQLEFIGDNFFSAQSTLDVPTPKPDPAIVLHALRAVGRDASTTVGIDDSRSGTLALVNAEVFTIGFVGCEETAAAQSELAGKLLSYGAALVVSDLRDVPKVVQMLNDSRNDPAIVETLVSQYRERWLAATTA
jgi:beta-phosphoglucomutase-like phosphatase (HAD superfamily)